MNIGTAFPLGVLLGHWLAFYLMWHAIKEMARPQPVEDDYRYPRHNSREDVIIIPPEKNEHNDDQG